MQLKSLPESSLNSVLTPQPPELRKFASGGSIFRLSMKTKFLLCLGAGDGFFGMLRHPPGRGHVWWSLGLSARKRPDHWPMRLRWFGRRSPKAKAPPPPPHSRSR